MSRRHVTFCVLTCAILGSSFTVSRSILPYPPLAGQALRYTLAAVALFAIVAFQPWIRPTTRELVRLAAVAATGLVAFNMLLLYALHHADPAVIGTIVGGSPLVMALLGPLQEGRRPAARLVACAAVVGIGAALVQGGGHGDRSGLAAAVGLLLAESAFSLLAAPLLPRLGPVRVSAWSTALAVPMLLVGVAASGERHRPPTPTEALALLFLGLVLTVVAFVCWYSGVKALGVERAGVFVGLVPVFALATVSIADRHLPGVLQLAGVLTVTGGLVAGLRAKQVPWQPPHSSSAPAASPASPGSSASSSAYVPRESTSPVPT